ncbi:MAG: hypothetical protein JWM76_2412 [Pseudonocardiales bacterium]|nr:hypothetical protein [Pseudonocardiales bacterium]
MDPDFSQGALRLVVAASGAAATALLVLFILIAQTIYSHRA